MTAAKKPSSPRAVPAAGVESTLTAGQQTARSLVEAGSQAASKGLEQAAEGLGKAAEAVAEGLEQAAAATREQATRQSEAAFTGYDEALRLGRDMLDTALKSGTAFGQGLEDLNRALITYAQESVEDGVEVAKAVAGAKSLKDALLVQTDYVRRSLDRALVESNRVGGMVLNLAQTAATLGLPAGFGATAGTRKAA